MRIQKTLIYLSLITLFSGCGDSEEKRTVFIQFDRDIPFSAIQLMETDVVSRKSKPIEGFGIDSVRHGITVVLDQPTMPDLMVYNYMNIPLYLAPGWQMAIVGSCADVSQVTFEGDGAEVNQALLEVSALKEQHSKPYPWELQPPQFLERWERYEEGYKDILENLNEKDTRILNHLWNSQRGLERLQYVMSHYGISGERSIPEVFQDYDQFDFDPELLRLGLSSYTHLAVSQLDAVIYPPLWENSSSAAEKAESWARLPSVAADHIRAMDGDDTFKEYLLAAHISKFLNLEGISAPIQSALDTFRTYYPKSNYLDGLEEKHAKLMSLEKGNPLPELLTVTSENDTVPIASFYGKVLYIDMWATWCKPCIEEFPNSVKLRQDYAQEDVDFLYLSVDTRDRRWQNYLTENPQLQGIHLRSLDIRDAYDRWQNAGIPRYLLLDK
ncbi:MAG: TlpA disulfide reductase family protein, partial [Bacteroidota bacterium]